MRTEEEEGDGREINHHGKSITVGGKQDADTKSLLEGVLLNRITDYTNYQLPIADQSVTFRFSNFSVLKLFHFFGGFGFGIKKIWDRKNLVSKKVSDSVSEKVSDSVLFRFWVSSHTDENANKQKVQAAS